MIRIIKDVNYILKYIDISLDDLKKTFNYGFTVKEVEDLFKLHDKDNDGKLLVGGYLQDTSTGQNSFLIGRLLANRTRDTSFGNNGFVTTAFTSNDSRAFDLKIQPNGRIVLAGISGGKIAFADNIEI